jgi:hypothetical protein
MPDINLRGSGRRFFLIDLFFFASSVRLGLRVLDLFLFREEEEEDPCPSEGEDGPEDDPEALHAKASVFLFDVVIACPRRVSSLFRCVAASVARRPLFSSSHRSEVDAAARDVRRAAVAFAPPGLFCRRRRRRYHLLATASTARWSRWSTRDDDDDDIIDVIIIIIVYI